MLDPFPIDLALGGLTSRFAGALLRPSDSQVVLGVTHPPDSDSGLEATNYLEPGLLRFDFIAGTIDFV